MQGFLNIILMILCISDLSSYSLSSFLSSFVYLFVLIEDTFLVGLADVEIFEFLWRIKCDDDDGE